MIALEMNPPLASYRTRIHGLLHCIPVPVGERGLFPF
jgi:hypothetical protein